MKINKTRRPNTLLALIITVALLLSIAPTAFAAETKTFDIPLWKADYSPNNTFTISNLYDFTDFDWNEAGYVVDTDSTITVNMPLNVFFTAAREDGYSETPIKDAEFITMSNYKEHSFTDGGETLSYISSGMSFKFNREGKFTILLTAGYSNREEKIRIEENTDWNYQVVQFLNFTVTENGKPVATTPTETTPVINANPNDLVLADALSISNVISKVPATELIDENDIFPTDEVYIANGPVSITALKNFDEFMLFGLSPMSSNGGYAYIEFGGFNPVGCEEQTWKLTAGMRYELTKPGFYYFHSMEDGICESLYIKDVPANPNSAKVIVNGVPVEFEAYNIYDNNYFKLRDVALALIGTEKQFEVTWDGENETINLISNKAYTRVGGELELGDGTQKRGLLCDSEILKDGEFCPLTAYTINNNNFFKLRDLGEAFDFDVTWNGYNIIIETDKPYTAD